MIFSVRSNEVIALKQPLPLAFHFIFFIEKVALYLKIREFIPILWFTRYTISVTSKSAISR